jgi:hypothetical protein
MNNKIFLYCCLYFYFTQILSAQIPQDTILYEKQEYLSLPMYIINDNVEYKFQKAENQKTYSLYKDTLLLLNKSIPNFSITSCVIDKSLSKIYLGHHQGYFILDYKKNTLITHTVSSRELNHIILANNKGCSLK